MLYLYLYLYLYMYMCMYICATMASHACYLVQATFAETTDQCNSTFWAKFISDKLPGIRASGLKLKMCYVSCVATLLQPHTDVHDLAWNMLHPGPAPKMKAHACRSGNAGRHHRDQTGNRPNSSGPKPTPRFRRAQIPAKPTQPLQKGCQPLRRACSSKCPGCLVTIFDSLQQGFGLRIFSGLGHKDCMQETSFIFLELMQESSNSKRNQSLET